VEPYEEVCLAAEQHDIGMGPWDAAPDRNPGTGLPYSFTEMPVALHLQQWRDGPRRLLPQSRYAALLAARHGSRLQSRRDLTRMRPAEADAVRHYLAEQRDFADTLATSLKAEPDELERNHQLIWTWDFLSLALCLNWPPTTAHEVPTAAEPAELRLAPTGAPSRIAIEPWPFRPPTLTVRCEGRRLNGPYDSDATMQRALEDAPWETLEFELVPAAQ
jgi:hypothetical protein